MNELDQLRQKVSELEAENDRIHRKSDDRFFTLFHASPNAMALTSTKTAKIIDLNDACTALWGYQREELLGNTTLERRIWADPKQRDEVMEMLQAGGSVRDLKVSLSNMETGGARTVLLSANAITFDGEACYLSVMSDVTTREREADGLHRSEENYRMLVENSLQGLAIIQNGRIVFCNSAYATISGYSISELLSFKDTVFIVHPDDQAMVFARYKDRLAGKTVPSNYEHRIIRRDGVERWVDIYVSMTEFNGCPAMQIVDIDITERKTAEKALQESEERFSLIAETIDEVFWINDAENGKTIYVSPAHERIWGYQRQDLYENAKSFYDHIHPDDRNRAAEQVALMKAGQQVSYEYRIIRPDGSVRQIWDRGFPIKDEAGHITRYVGVAQDISARKRAEAAVTESREYLNRVINCIADPIFVKDRQHRFALVNDAVCKFMGVRRDQLLGNTGFRAMSREQAAMLWEQEEAAFNTAKDGETEEEIINGQGERCTVMAKKALLMDTNGRKQIVGILRDITEYKHLESQLMQAQKMEAIGVLAGGVAHDFNNLLSVINGYSELLIENLEENDPRREDLEQIGEAGRRGAALTSQLLAFGRKQLLQPEVLDLNMIVKDIGTMLCRLIGENIKLETITPSELGLVSADPGRIQQIIMNLAINSRDAMPQGGKLMIETANIEIDGDYARLHQTMVPGPHVMIAISDTGTGMDASTQAHIFEPFFTTKEKGKGTGLGLSTVYGIVKQSNGYIGVYSEPGRGTTFKIYFPRIQGEIPQPTNEVKSEHGFHGGETVLIAEDEAAVRTLAGRILRDRGYLVLEASDGIDALRKAREFAGAIHLVLTDVIMPGINGKELVSRLKSDRPGIKSLYVSGYTDNMIGHQGELDSHIAFLQKPFSADDLARKVQEVLNP